MAPAHPYCVVLTTTNSEPNARAIVDAVLARKLAACVQIMPITSHYVWDGKTVEDNELLMLMKAKTADFADLEATIRSVHGYTVPEVIRIPIEDGSGAYLDWIRSVTR